MAIWPTYDDITEVLYELTAGLFGSESDSFPAFTVRDRGLLESALALPHQPYYETFAEKLAALVRSIAANHALADGNKRLALTVLHSALIVNGYLYQWSDEEAEEIILRVASGESDFKWLAEFIESRVTYVANELDSFARHELAEEIRRRQGA